MNQTKEGWEKDFDYLFKYLYGEQFARVEDYKKVKDFIRLNRKESEQRVATEIFTELLKIAAAGEYEDMRREVENLKHQYDIKD